jgi:hypothetical protein
MTGSPAFYRFADSRSAGSRLMQVEYFYQGNIDLSIKPG